MAHYLYIRARNSPISIGQDTESRAMIALNFEAMADTSLSWAEDIVELLRLRSLGTFGTSLFIGPQANIDNSFGDGPFMTINTTGGSRSTIYQTERYPLLSAQIIVRGKFYQATNIHADKVYSALDGLYNITVTIPE